MEKMRKMIDKLHARQEELANKEDGFSLLELVVAVSIMLILAVVGFIAYQGLTDNARDAAVDSAANQVLTAAIAADNAPDATPEDVLAVATDYNESSDGVTVSISGSAEGLIVEAQYDDNPEQHNTSITAPGKYAHIGNAGGGE